jgi:putative tryptophan/tyrosine transport system substrate-binding protein
MLPLGLGQRMQSGQLKRRTFITLLGGAATWPLATRAQQSRLPTIGFLGATTLAVEGSRDAVLVQRLRELGWIEGRSIAIEYRWAEGRNERFAEIAAEFVRLKVEVIVTYGTAPTLAAKHATSAIPIVFAISGDPVGTGLVPVWRGRAATSRACPRSKRTQSPSGSKSCTRCSLA